MQFLRWSIILTLLLGLPIFAVLNDLEKVKRLFGGKTSDLQASSVEPEEGGKSSDTSRRVNDPPTDSPRRPPAVFPKLKPETTEVPEQLGTSPDAIAAAGRPLRSAVYRPSGDPGRIHRQLAKSTAEKKVSDSIPDIEKQLQAMGVRHYQMDEANGAYIFKCQFPSQDAEGRPVIFESKSATGEAAMRHVLAQAQEWQRSLR